MKSRYASPLGVRVPQERLTDLRISLMPSGLANQYYGLIPQQLLPCVRACGAYLRKFSNISNSIILSITTICKSNFNNP